MKWEKQYNESIEEYLARIGVSQEHDEKIIIDNEELEADENGNVKE